jgi:hypothetical protein
LQGLKIEETMPRYFFALLAAAVALPAAGEPEFTHDIQPLLAAKCGACHSGAKPQAGLAVHTRDELMKGGASGPAIVPGNGASSLIVMRVSGANSARMPPTGDPLTTEQIETLRRWIDGGAKVAAAAAQYPAASLSLAAPELPQAPALWSLNPIDRIVYAYFERWKTELPAVVSDAQFARRVYLDLWGLSPAPGELTAFLATAADGKRTALVERLLADNQLYGQHWISFWNDLLRNDEGVIYHGGRASITKWLLNALESNKRYDAFVSELLNPTADGGAEGFLAGVNWRGDVSASQTPPMQAAMNSAQVFLGANLKCAACHDSFVSRWKLRQTYGLASFFSEGPMKLVRCDVELEERAEPRFLFPELGEVAIDATLAERRQAAARMFTAPENGRFARTVMNRLWKQLLGRGIVEPVDDMDAEPWSRELLDWLAADFVQNGYDLKRTMRLIATSRAYQLPADAGVDAPYRFRGPRVRRLSAEQFVDGISQVTGEWRVLIPRTAGAGSYAREWRFKSSPLTRALGRPIRDQVYTERETKATTLQALEMVNGRELSRMLWRGARKMLGQLPAAPAPLMDSGNLGGGALRALARKPLGGARRLHLLIEDMESYDPKRVVAGWADAYLYRADGSRVALATLAADRKFTVGSIQTRDEPAEVMMAGFPSQLVFDLEDKGFIEFEAKAAVQAQPSAVGILPNLRFFVFTEEPVPDSLVAVTGEPPVAAPARARTTSELIDGIWMRAYGRRPSVQEVAAAERIAGRPVSAAGLEDLLWSVFLSAEYQFIP